MLKIRLMRIGAKKRPFYRVVVVDERVKRTGGYIENLGTYNPLTEPKEVKLNQARIDYWVKQGAQPSDGYLRMIGKAPQRPPRKPKKEKKVEEPKATEETAKSEPAKASGAVEPTTEPEITSQEQGAKQTPSERHGRASSALAEQADSEPNKKERGAQPSDQSEKPKEKK